MKREKIPTWLLEDFVIRPDKAINGFRVPEEMVAFGWYTLVLVVGFHLRVVLYEEPRLEKLFGDQWKSHSAAVPRWFIHRISQKE